MADQAKKRPVHEVRIGSIKAAVWQNSGPSGSWHAVTIERLYKEGDAWKTSGSFGRDDLLVVAKVSDLAHSWIVEAEATQDDS